MLPATAQGYGCQSQIEFMGLARVVQWWEEWQLHILALGSLTIQCSLAVFAGARKSHIRPLSRFLIWLSYLGSDALAIYALATLFNRQSKVQRSSAHASRDLEVLWTPILLMHLGGQATITAYNIEDNELWRRHIVTAISQVTVALYVFSKSWSPSADKRLLAAAILLFIPGVFKCFEKPLALKSASYNSLVTSLFAGDSRPTTTNREVELEEYIQKARGFVRNNKSPPELDHDRSEAYLKLLGRPDRLFTDVMYSYSDRFDNLNSFWLLNNKRAYKALENGLSNLFDLLYTKDVGTKVRYHLSYFCCALYTRMSTIALPIVAIGLFHSSHKKVYRGSDVIVTYVLLYITFFLELYSFLALFYLSWTWPATIPQHSLVGFFARNKRRTCLMGIMGCLQLRDFFDKYWCTCSSATAITNIVRGHVKDGWLNYILDAESYRAFCDIRGHWTLQRKGLCGQLVSESIEKPFDESVLMWHVATNFCFYRQGASPDHEECASRCREISNYMMHLLFANPDMLMPGSRGNLFTAAYKEIKHLLRGEDLPLADEKELTQKIMDKVDLDTSSKQGFIREAWALSQELIMRLDDEQTTWEVIKGVWVEMVCFSAGRCRGFLHAKSLGSGGEYLSFIWLLMSHAGLETFAERQQRVQLRLPKEDRVNIAMQRIQETARDDQTTDTLTAQGTVPVKEKNAATPPASEANGSLKQEEHVPVPLPLRSRLLYHHERKVCPPSILYSLRDGALIRACLFQLLKSFR